MFFAFGLTPIISSVMFENLMLMKEQYHRLGSFGTCKIAVFFFIKFVQF